MVSRGATSRGSGLVRGRGVNRGRPSGAVRGTGANLKPVGARSGMVTGPADQAEVERDEMEEEEEMEEDEPRTGDRRKRRERSQESALAGPPVKR
jgi:hypothetical protein